MGRILLVAMLCGSAAAGRPHLEPIHNMEVAAAVRPISTAPAGAVAVPVARPQAGPVTALDKVAAMGLVTSPPARDIAAPTAKPQADRADVLNRVAAAGPVTASSARAAAPVAGPVGGRATAVDAWEVITFWPHHEPAPGMYLHSLRQRIIQARADGREYGADLRRYREWADRWLGGREP
jgi:hypothetical protein